MGLEVLVLLLFVQLSLGGNPSCRNSTSLCFKLCKVLLALLQRIVFESTSMCS